MDIPESEITVDFFRASGPGGQHRNTTDSAVRIRHLPTGIVVTASESRSQLRNRETAMERLREALRRRAHRAKKRVATKVPRRKKEERLDVKRRTGEKKRLRKPPED
jgi:peptide chain release factor